MTYGASPDGDRAGGLRPETAQQAQPEALIPSAPRKPLWLDQRRIEFRAEFDNGPFVISSPRVLTPAEIADLEAYLGLAVSGFVRRAQAIEARQGGNGEAGAVHESAVGKADAPEQSGQRSLTHDR